jgi:DNA (cytosine-5)-methyltransferase 1
VKIKVIDLFAGPGGLGEGFSSLQGKKFEVVLSIEKDVYAHKTLFLRSIFRKLKNRERLSVFEYYKNPHDRSLLKLSIKYQRIWRKASLDACKIELSPKTRSFVRKIIQTKIGKNTKWILVGGPPCQAYSLVGRARRTNETKKKFEKDKRHTLYKEYLAIIKHFKPPAFVMENVKGILSAKHKGGKIFQKICNDLSNEGYSLSSLTGKPSISTNGKWRTESFILKAEEYGVPQARHRVFIIGVRNDLNKKISPLRKSRKFITVKQALAGLPKIRSRLSTHDKFFKWLEARNKGLLLAGQKIKKSAFDFSGSEFIAKPIKKNEFMADLQMKGVPNHQSRSHLASDIQRYAYLAALASKTGKSPKINELPRSLKPAHKNIFKKNIPFADRFKVQIDDRPASTITSHISKDGHYYIHPDFRQARSLTVREAARIQTFPDNYRFEGPRTEQYKQVGNAVPPLLARKIALSILSIFK